MALLAVYEYLPYWRNRTELQELRKEVLMETGHSTDVGEEMDSARNQFRQLDWEKLKKKNSDIIAWIEVPGTNIDYPVLKSSEWNEYLDKDYKNRKSELGSIFIQPETKTDFTDPHTILYGHNMRDRQMFGSLHRYESEKFWKNHRKIYLHLPGQVLTAKVYSTYDCDDQTSTYQTDFSDEQEFHGWTEMSVSKRYYDTGLEPKAGSRIITLSTCSNGRGHSSRYVVHAVVSNS